MLYLGVPPYPPVGGQGSGFAGVPWPLRPLGPNFLFFDKRKFNKEKDDKRGALLNPPLSPKWFPNVAQRRVSVQHMLPLQSPGALAHSGSGQFQSPPFPPSSKLSGSVSRSLEPLARRNQLRFARIRNVLPAKCRHLPSILQYENRWLP